MTTTHPTANETTLAEVARDKRELLAQLPAFERTLSDIEALERDEQEQFRAIEQQHRERLEHFAQAKRAAKANIGRCHAAGQWLAVNRPALEATSQIAKSTARVGRDGRTTETANIGS